jgi:hypothetical protein
VVNVSCGVMHTVCVLASGVVLFWATGCAPIPIPGLQHVRLVACSSLDTYFVTAAPNAPVTLIAWNADKPASFEVVGTLSEPVEQLAGC